MRSRSSFFVLSLAVVIACGERSPRGASPKIATARAAVDPVDGSVVQHHNHASRDGMFIQPTLTRAAAATMHLDATFDGTFAGNVYAQPLYVANGVAGAGTFYVVTQDNAVFAIDEATGTTLWTQSYGTPVVKIGLPLCGNVSPLGILGTPYIDLDSRAMFFDTAIGDAAGTTLVTHLIHAISIDDGTELAGWPVDASTLSSAAGAFEPQLQNQRGALIVVGDTLYVPYGGHFSDCGAFRGTIIGVPLADPSLAQAWATDTEGAGIWAPGGLASDGTDLFAATGNGGGAALTWAGSEAILRLQPGPTFSAVTTDYFTPTNWMSLDSADEDIGGSGPLLLDVVGATPSKLVMAFGKNGRSYLMDRSDLGGIGGQLDASKFLTGPIINASASVATPTGTYVVFRTYGGDLAAQKIGATAPPTIIAAWTVTTGGIGSPAITTTDGTSESIVWAVSAEAPVPKLYGLNAETGTVVFNGGVDVLSGVRRFSTVIAVNGRIFVAGDNALYAFTP